MPSYSSVQQDVSVPSQHIAMPRQDTLVLGMEFMHHPNLRGIVLVQEYAKLE